jgi:hypothetical protein
MMPYSTLNDPVDVARACAALDRAWAEIRRSAPAHFICARGMQERERLAVIVVGLAMTAIDETDLAQIAIRKFWRAGLAVDAMESSLDDDRHLSPLP